MSLSRRCDCVISRKGGKPHPADKEKQPIVNLYRSFDDRFFSGSCHICKEERDLDKLSIYHRDISLEKDLSYGSIWLDIRYCNDKPECLEQAKIKYFFNKKEK